MKAPLSSYLFTDLKFAQFTNDLLKEFSIGNKQTKTTENPPPIRIPISSISQRVINYMYNIKLINSILAIFLSAMISLAICCCVKPSMINNTIYFDICSIIVILYFGAATASNSSINRKTGLIFAFVFGLIFFVVISYLSLGPFDIRPLILSQISIPARLVNVITSLIATYIAYSLYYPCLKLHQIYRSLITLNYDIFRWQLCQEAYKLYKPFYRTIFKSIHRLTPFLTISFIAARWYLVHIPRLDMIADISYLSLQLLISIFLFLMTKPGLRLILNDPYKYLTEFDKTRNFDHGKRFFKVLNRSLDMLPNYATALVTFPLVVAFCCVVYGISYLMSGTSQEIARVLPLFVVAVSDLAISCNKISGSFGISSPRFENCDEANCYIVTGSGKLPVLTENTNAIKLYFQGFTSTAKNALASYSHLTNITFDDKMKILDDELIAGTKVEYFTIPKNVYSLINNPFDNSAYVKAIYVHKDNQYFRDIDGIVFSKNLKSLVIYPGNHGETYAIVPNFVEYIEDNAFCSSTLIKIIFIHQNVKRIGFQFYNMNELEYVYIQNKNLSSLQLKLSMTLKDRSIIHFNPLPKESFQCVAC